MTGIVVIAVQAHDHDMTLCWSIRHAVFVVEQGVPEALDRDGRDLQACHLLARRMGEPVGTARVLLMDQHTARIGRVAVLAHARRCGVGEALMRAVVDEPALRAVTRFELHAQADAVAFYRRLGYSVCGAPFIEASMPHVAMIHKRDRA